MNKQKSTYALHPATRARVQHYAKALGLTQSEIIQRAVNAFDPRYKYLTRIVFDDEQLGATGFDPSACSLADAVKSYIAVVNAAPHSAIIPRDVPFSTQTTYGVKAYIYDRETGEVSNV